MLRSDADRYNPDTDYIVCPICDEHIRVWKYAKLYSNSPTHKVLMCPHCEGQVKVSLVVEEE
jgi:uncharacterized protein YbaR (Trm112 family)